MGHTRFVRFRGRKYTLQMKGNRCVSIIHGAKIPCKYQMTDLLGGIIRNILCSQCRRLRYLQKMRCVVPHVAKTSPQMKLETAPLFRLMNLHAPCCVVYILSLSCWHSRSEDSVPVLVQSFFNSHHPRRRLEGS